MNDREFKAEELFWCINEIRRMCDEHVQKCGAKCPIGQNCNAMIRQIEQDIKYAEAAKQKARCQFGEN